MSQQYRDISSCGIECQELTKYDADIEKDLLRTFPKVPQFASSPNVSNNHGHHPVNMSFSVISHLNESQTRLSRVLSAFAYYDHGIGYMQGMNFIMASIMYHCNEEVAFWVFV